MLRCKIHEAAELADQVANGISENCQMSSGEVDSGARLRWGVAESGHFFGLVLRHV